MDFRKSNGDFKKSNGVLRNFNSGIKSVNADLSTGSVDKNGQKMPREVTKSALKARSYAKTAAKTLSVSRKLLLLRADYYQEGSRMVGALRDTLETL